MKRLWKSFYLLPMIILLGSFVSKTVLAAEAQNSWTNVQKQPSYQLTVRGRIGEENYPIDDPKDEPDPDNGRKIIVGDGSKLGKLPKTGSVGEPFIFLGLALLVLWGILVRKNTLEQ
ncbi:LPXTG cell wall anchor domain-containing protein [Enterococcus gallinarum]|uniref:LPXTG cell wall anchor domain-containing protein n=1 Tax=Enterococcus gallinarum TaxID=1353 RepID=UPI0012DC7847|nr:LPXTG cell wall anchor domain-containing protein [Enterococcus gallinarum]MCD4985400.1 LPXTG cell wall anchor domain-containing protein [Enterococcus gallinarum]MCI1136022.1 LPXTG cell wall anchor domain-containing protein [Enterococcus gallinarum]MDT2719261.1 LPXTG cell wall anchor domain-containing protein [Enterococcus gallinarum]MDV7784970.1 LPXTG cell wall anchor domain-containing protein [Enterococcus gallinarum]QGR82113.1 LPXTG cell wall anchor domain-containing protein [Enterococcus